MTNGETLYQTNTLSVLKYAHARTQAYTRNNCFTWCSMEVDYSLLTMTSEWDRTEDIMNKTDALLKSFDAMADQHVLIHKTAFDPAQFAEDGTCRVGHK